MAGGHLPHDRVQDRGGRLAAPATGPDTDEVAPEARPFRVVYADGPDLAHLRQVWEASNASRFEPRRHAKQQADELLGHPEPQTATTAPSRSRPQTPPYLVVRGHNLAWGFMLDIGQGVRYNSPKPKEVG